MTTIYDLSKNVFATNTRYTKPSRRAIKAMSQPLESNIGIEMTYEDCDEVNGGVAVLTLIKAAGVCGSIVSVLCSMVLLYDDLSKSFNLNWGARLALKITRGVGDILSTVAFMTNAVKGEVANIFARIIRGNDPILDANIAAGVLKAFGIGAHTASFFS